MVTKKRFKVHSMIQDMEVGEIMDLELCEELIRKYGSLSDIHLFIEDNGNDMTYQEVVDLLNENEQLKQYKQSVNDVLRSWSQKNLTAKQLQVVLAIMEELNVIGDVE